MGATMPRILLRHVAPNTFAAMMVMASLVFAGSIVAEAGLAFLGVGAPTFAPSWGNLIVRGRDFLGSSPWISFFPGIFLTLMGAGHQRDRRRPARRPRSRDSDGVSSICRCACTREASQ